MPVKLNTPSKDRRVQFDLLPERIAEMDQLLLFCDLKTRKDLFDNAMTLFEWAVEEVRNGKQIASYNRSTDHVEVVRFPVLENSARRAQMTKSISLVSSTAQEEAEATQQPRMSRPTLVHS